MDCKVVTSSKAKSAKSLLTRFALFRLASALCHGTVVDKEAGREVLYGLPGVFSMTITAGGQKVRLLKEADTFRRMKSSEISDNLLTICFNDVTALGDVVSHECTMHKALAEGRLSFTGKTSYLAVLLRASAAGDKTLLTPEEYEELYREGEE